MKKRIFTAIDISLIAKKKISDYINILRTEFSDLRVGWEKPEKLHLTMKFLGDIDDGQIPELQNAAANTAKKISNFKVEIVGTGVFPAKRNAKILWLGLREASGKLAEINRVLEDECEKIGFLREIRNFKPHLTIGRLREPDKSKILVEKHLENDFEPVEFMVSEIVIYESKLLPTGSIYTVLSRHVLK